MRQVPMPPLFDWKAARGQPVPVEVMAEMAMMAARGTEELGGFAADVIASPAAGGMLTPIPLQGVWAVITDNEYAPLHSFAAVVIDPADETDHVQPDGALTGSFNALEVNGLSAPVGTLVYLLPSEASSGEAWRFSLPGNDTYPFDSTFYLAEDTVFQLLSGAVLSLVNGGLTIDGTLVTYASTSQVVIDGTPVAITGDTTWTIDASETWTVTGGSNSGLYLDVNVTLPTHTWTVPAGNTWTIAGGGTVDFTGVTVTGLAASNKDHHAWRHRGTTPHESWYYGGVLAATSAGFATAYTGVAGRYVLLPLIAPAGGTLDRIAVRVSGGGGAGVTILLAIYEATSATNLYPGDLLLSCGEVDTGAAGIKSITISQALSAGTLYWLALMCEGTPGLYSVAIDDLWPVLGGGSGFDAVDGVGYYLDDAYTGSADDPFPAGATVLRYADSPFPAIGVRFSA